jgi:hypothetical protein
MRTALSLLVLLTVFLAGCGRSSRGVYQSVGDEDKFRMVLELADAGRAKFTTRSNLGNPELDRAVASTMSIPSGQWTEDGAKVVVTGTGADGKAATYRFARQQNGDLVWEKNGARLVRSK